MSTNAMGYCKGEIGHWSGSALWVCEDSSCPMHFSHAPRAGEQNGAAPQVSSVLADKAGPDPLIRDTRSQRDDDTGPAAAAPPDVGDPR